jgi:hypothetical protein
MSEEESVSLIEEKASMGFSEDGGRTLERMAWETVGWSSSLIPKKVTMSVSKTLTLWIVGRPCRTFFVSDPVWNFVIPSA